MGIMPKNKISMGTKRKQDQWRDDSSSSDAKRCRSCSAACSDGPSDGMPREGFSDTSFRDAVIELKDVIQVKVSTEEKFKRKVEKLKEKRKKDKNKHEEDLRILKKDLRLLKKNLRILKEDHEELKLQIQEIRKEGCAEVNHYKASPSQRSQLSQSTRFRLVIENTVSRTIFKKETIETEDGGGHIKVVMYDGGNPIASDHPVASARVDLVVIEGSFNEPKRDSWSKEEFEESIIKPRKGITRLVKNGTFNLIGGSCDHEGAIIMDNSQQREVKLGVMIAVHTGVRVLEGVSNPFKVQEGKTKKLAPNKKGNKISPPVRVRNLVQPTSTHATQHGQGPDEQHSLPPPVIQGVLQKADRGKHSEFPTDDIAEDNRPSYPPATVALMVDRNGQALNNNSRQSFQQIPSPNLWQSTSTHSMQHDQGCSLPRSSMQNPLQVAGYCPFNQHLLACDQDPFTSLPNASSQLAFLNLSAQASLNDIRQWTSFPEGDIPVEAVNDLDVQTQIPEHYGTFRCGQVLLHWDKPNVELKQHWDFLDQLMPLYRTQSRFYRESFPSTSIMDKGHKLLASISSSDLKMIPQRGGVLIQPIEPYDSDYEPPVKKQRNAKYQLRFVNRVCNDYYTWEQIKSEDGDLLKVALYDENNLVVTSGPLSSASVEVLLLHGDFDDERQDHWTLEEFTACLVHPQSLQEPPALGGDRVLSLTDGEADIGNVYFRTSSFHARTGKFKMGVKIKNAREGTIFCESSPRGRYNFSVRVQCQNWNVQEGITSPFLVRVRQGDESSSHWIASLSTLLRVSKLFRAAWECDAKENVGASSELHDQLLQVGSVLAASMVEHHGNIVQMASDQPPEPSCHDVEWPSPCTLWKAQCPQMNAKYQLRFFNKVCNDYYTREHIKSEDGNLLKVALYDVNNAIVTSGPLPSASEVVLLPGDFNAEGQDYWTSEEFSDCLVHPQSVEGPPALGGDCVLALTEGEADLGNVNFQTSSFHGRAGKFKMGVNIKNIREESVQEGITSPFTGRVHQGEESGHHRISSLGTLVKVRKGLPKQVCGALENIGRPAFHDPVAQEYKDDVPWLMRVASRVEDHDSMVHAASNRRPEPPSHGIQCSAPSTFQIEKEEHFLTQGREEIKDAHDFATTVAEPSSPVSVKASRARCAPLFSINGRSKDD